jgi:hypothetical protein
MGTSYLRRDGIQMENDRATMTVTIELPYVHKSEGTESEEISKLTIILGEGRHARLACSGVSLSEARLEISDLERIGLIAGAFREPPLTSLSIRTPRAPGPTGRGAVNHGPSFEDKPIGEPSGHG